MCRGENFDPKELSGMDESAVPELSFKVVDYLVPILDHERSRKEFYLVLLIDEGCSLPKVHQLPVIVAIPSEMA